MSVSPFGAGLLLFAAGLVIGAAAPTMLLLVIGRAVQGLGAGAVSAAAVTTVARGYPADERPRVFALMSTAWVVPSLVGPAVSGVIAETVGWRWVVRRTAAAHRRLAVESPSLGCARLAAPRKATARPRRAP